MYCHSQYDFQHRSVWQSQLADSIGLLLALTCTTGGCLLIWEWSQKNTTLSCWSGGRGKLCAIMELVLPLLFVLKVILSVSRSSSHPLAILGVHFVVCWLLQLVKQLRCFELGPILCRSHFWSNLCCFTLQLRAILSLRDILPSFVSHCSAEAGG